MFFLYNDVTNTLTSVDSSKFITNTSSEYINKTNMNAWTVFKTISENMISASQFMKQKYMHEYEEKTCSKETKI